LRERTPSTINWHADRYLSVMRLCAFLLLTIVPCCGSAEQAPPHGLIVSSILVSPEEYTDDGGRYDLFVQAVPGGKVTRLTDHRANPKLKLGGAIREPLFSHDGKRVLFFADYPDPSGSAGSSWIGVSPFNNNGLNIWDVQLDTRKASPITKGDWGWNVVGWSPDDRYICAVYPTDLRSIVQETPIPDDIYVWDMRTLKGRKVVRVAQGAAGVSWSRDGSRIIYQQSWGKDANLYSVPRQGGKPKVMLRGKIYGYEFSPAGRRLAYTDIHKVYVANADGSKPKLIVKMTRDEHSAWAPELQWSRDSKKLAIVIYEPSGKAQTLIKLHVYDESIGKDRVVATLQESVSVRAWSRNGQWVIVQVAHSGATKEPDPKTGRYDFCRQGLLAIAIADGHIVTLKEPNEETKGLDWFEE